MILEKTVERDIRGLITRITELVLKPDEEAAFDAYRELRRKAAEAPSPEAIITINVSSANLPRVREAFMARLIADTALWDRTGWRRLTVIVRQA